MSPRPARPETQDQSAMEKPNDVRVAPPSPLLAENWPVWLLSAVLVVAAVIDGWRLRVPNWITFPLVFGGWIYSTASFGWEGLGWS